VNAREVEVNRDLQQLDDAHRLGLITRPEYRQRRRKVLAWLDAPASSAGPLPAQAMASVAPLFGLRPRTAAVLLGLIALAMLFWFLIR
jgi:hypothetical protein